MQLSTRFSVSFASAACIALLVSGMWTVTAQDQSGAGEIPAEGQERYDALQERATAARDRGALEDALDYYAQMQEMAPDSAELFYNRGVLLLDLERYTRAAGLFESAIEEGLSDAAVYYNYGNALYQLGRFEDARAAYESARESAPEDAEVVNNLALTLVRLGETDAARQAFEEAGTLDPSWAVPFFHLGNLFYDRGELDTADQAYTEALNRDAAFYRAQFNRGNVRYRQERYREAFSDFLAVHEMRPDDNDVLYNLGASAVAAAENAGVDESAASADEQPDDEGEGDDAEAQGE